MQLVLFSARKMRLCGLGGGVAVWCLRAGAGAGECVCLRLIGAVGGAERFWRVV